MEDSNSGVNRRDFAAMLPMMLGAAAALAANTAQGQAAQSTAPPAGATAIATPPRQLRQLASGVFPPQPSRGMQGGHESHQFVTGMLAAGNIRLEMHESVQAAGAPHEAIGTHKHSEIWLVQRGTATLYLNGTEHKMQAGDVGLCCAGDEHWIANGGDTELAYFVITVGPPE